MSVTFNVDKLVTLFDVLRKDGQLEYRDQNDVDKSGDEFFDDFIDGLLSFTDPGDVNIETERVRLMNRNSGLTLKEMTGLLELGLLEDVNQAWHSTYAPASNDYVKSVLDHIEAQARFLLERGETEMTIKSEKRFHLSSEQEGFMSTFISEYI